MIYFDSTGEFGLFKYGYAVGRLSGASMIVCIKKLKNKWTIDKKIALSVA